MAAKNSPSVWCITRASIWTIQRYHADRLDGLTIATDTTPQSNRYVLRRPCILLRRPVNVVIMHIYVHANMHMCTCMYVRRLCMLLPYGLRHRRIKVFRRYRQRPLRHLTFSDRRGPYGRPSTVAADCSVAETVWRSGNPVFGTGYVDAPPSWANYGVAEILL